MLLAINDLTCIRNDRIIFDGLSFTLSSGRALVLKGANGSGKSSLLKIISGSLEAHGGELSFGDDGFNYLRNFEWLSENIAYLGHKNALKSEMTVEENIRFWHDVSGGEGLLILPLLDEMGIGYLRKTLCSKLSSGQSRRAAMSRLVAYSGTNFKKIWLLDEPTVGLDYDGVQKLNHVMKNHLEKGGMIIMATHVDVGLGANLYDFLSLDDFKPENLLDMGDRW